MPIKKCLRLLALSVPLGAALVFDLTVSAQSAAPTQSAAPPLAVKPGAIWLDVRTPGEFATGHLKDAINLPYEKIAQKIKELAPDKEMPIRLYCRSGRRSGIARQTLLDMGYTNVENKGAYEDLK